MATGTGAITFPVPTVNGTNGYAYWRLTVLTCAAGNDGYTQIEDLIFATSVGGSTIATGGTATASGSTGSETPDKAFAGTGGYWTSANMGAGVAGAWIQYQFASPVVPTYFKLQGVQDNRIPETFKIEASTDGSTWVAKGVFGRSGAALKQAHFISGLMYTPSSAERRFWRIKVTEVNGSLNAVIAEVKMASSAGGSQLVQTAFGNAYTNPTTLLAPNCLDSDLTTYWVGAVADTPVWVGQLASHAIIKELTITPRSTGGGYDSTQDLKAFTLDWSTDEATWTTAFSISNLTSGWAQGTARTFIIPVGEVTATVPALAGTGTAATGNSGAVTAAKPVVAGAGSMNSVTRTGSAAVAAARPVIVGTGTRSSAASGAVAVPVFALAGTGRRSLVGSGAVMIPKLAAGDRSPLQYAVIVLGRVVSITNGPLPDSTSSTLYFSLVGISPVPAIGDYFSEICGTFDSAPPTLDSGDIAPPYPPLTSIIATTVSTVTTTTTTTTGPAPLAWVVPTLIPFHAA